MSKLDELINELCPDGIMYVSLLDVANVLYGYPCDASKFNTDGMGLPLARIRDVLSGSTETFTTEPIPEKYFLEKGDLLVGMDGNFHVANWKMDNGVLCQRVCKVSSKDNNIVLDGYLSHVLKPIIKKVEDSKQSGTVKHLLDRDIKALQIPLPDLLIQREIVRILDSFTLLTAELTAELTARRQQYEFYRDYLLNFEDDSYSLVDDVEKINILGVRKYKLEDIAHYSKDRISADSVSADSYVGVDNLLPNKGGKTLSEHIPTVGNLTKYVIGDILIGNIRPYLKKIWLADNEGGTNGDVLDIRITDTKIITPKYLYYVLSSDSFFNYDMQYAKGAKMPRGDKASVMNYVVSVPSLETQKKIVEILDRFDKLANDMSEGLPAEIEARKQQYEYYRDVLLSFDEERRSQFIKVERERERAMPQ